MRVSWFAVLAAGLLIAGCGAERQDEDEPEGEFRVQVTDAKFPAEQRIAEDSKLLIEVRNADERTVPNVAVTVRTQPLEPGAAPIAFGVQSSDERLADTEKPVWIVNKGPKGGDSSYTSTWALGPLPPGTSKTFEWDVTAVRAGTYTIDYRVSPGLDGKARPVQGERTRGSFDVTISDEPVPARVDDEGNVVRGETASAGND
jgi:hypothetical protein